MSEIENYNSVRPLFLNGADAADKEQEGGDCKETCKVSCQSSCQVQCKSGCEIVYK